MSDEMERYTMRSAVVQDGIYMRSKCLVHADCRHHGKMVFPSGRRVDLKTKTGDIKDLNANFVSHLERSATRRTARHTRTRGGRASSTGRAPPSSSRTTARPARVRSVRSVPTWRWMRRRIRSATR